jgi:endonuclease/exonuclease/phosphatase family metal-dependent hydrolase
MKIMTFNTLHCCDWLAKRIDFEVIANAIKKFDPDIVGLNEMRDEGTHPEYSAQAKILSELTGMPNYYFAKAYQFPGGPYGNAFLTKLPIESVETIGIPDPDPKTGTDYYETRCLLKARLQGGITVLVSHFGLNQDERENAVKTVVENLADEKCILMGDFNALPEDPVLDPIRARMKDTAVAFTVPKLSFPADEPTIKIDYVFVSPDVEILSADIPAIVASDHRPHVAEVKL